MKSPLIALAAVFLVAPGAAAAPALRGDITVSKPVVTVGDMFDDAGHFAETGIFLAPAPGTTGTVPLTDLRRAAALIGLTEFDAAGLARVRVARAARQIDAETLGGLITGDLARRGIIAPEVTADIRFERQIELSAEAVPDPVEVLSLRYTPANGGFVARFAVAGIETPVEVGGTLTLMTPLPKLTANKPAGSVLSRDDFEISPVPLSVAEAGGYADLDQLTGKQLIRASRAGVVLRIKDVAEPSAVRRNSVVTVVLRSGAMTLTVKGTALGTVPANTPVDVLNLATRKVLHGLARANGTVEIVTSSFAVAAAGL